MNVVVGPLDCESELWHISVNIYMALNPDTNSESSLFETGHEERLRYAGRDESLSFTSWCCLLVNAGASYISVITLKKKDLATFVLLRVT